MPDEPRPNPDASIDFLKRWAPDGPWVLTAIFTERRGTATRTFRSEDEVRAWLTEHELSNLYFHVNPVLRDLDKKASREDVAALAWLHVDIDPRAGEDLQAERERALRLLRQPPGDLPPPTCIVFSGGGYQGFWKLTEPLPIDGEEEKYEFAKLYNLQLELDFGADNCHNVDRIMRLPGTVNWPNKKKREKGREPTLSHLVEWGGQANPIERFTPAPAIQDADDFSAAKVQVSEGGRRLKNVDDLDKWEVPQRTKMLIVQGSDPDDPTKYASRSEALFAVCCELVRAGVDDDTIYTVITDPDFAISASVLDKRASKQKYAVRQIQRAREESDNPWLRKMNEKHAVIGNMGGKCRVIQEVWDHNLKRWRISKQSFEDFRNRYMNKQVDTGTKDKDGNPEMKALGHWWLLHPDRQQFETIEFVPGQEIEGAYNLWRGFSCEPAKGDCQMLLDHTKEIVCAGDEGHFTYLMGWMARAVQHPASPGYIAVILRGGQGTGKSIFAKMFGELWGRHFLPVTDPQHLVGHFNAHLRDCVVLLGDEAFYAGDKRHESILKMLITEEMLTITPKGVDMEVSSNYIHLIMASNDKWVVPAGVDDRRFFVLDVADTQRNNTSHFGELRAQYDGDGKAAFLYHLMHYDLAGFDVRTPPKTKALQEQKMFSLSPEEEWWFNKLRDGRIMPEHDDWTGAAVCEALTTDYATYTQRFAVNRRGNATRLGRFLRRVCPELAKKQGNEPVEVALLSGVTKTLSRPYYWVFSDLETCREHWDKHFGGPYDWPAEELEEYVETKEAVPF